MGARQHQPLPRHWSTSSSTSSASSTTSRATKPTQLHARSSPRLVLVSVPIPPSVLRSIAAYPINLATGFGRLCAQLEPVLDAVFVPLEAFLQRWFRLLLRDTRGHNCAMTRCWAERGVGEPCGSNGAGNGIVFAQLFDGSCIARLRVVDGHQMVERGCCACLCGSTSVAPPSSQIKLR
ncbi:hypothetical protein L1887_57201 [Cichorium endivia]|nr:hypothetical protein L1887_57201 [Cichorium endivia]